MRPPARGSTKRSAESKPQIISRAKDAGLIVPEDPNHPRAGYVPFWTRDYEKI